MKKRKSFLLHLDSLEVLDDLTNEEAGILLKAMRGHHTGEIVGLDRLMKMVFKPFKNQFLRDDEKYAETCERNRQRALKRHSAAGKSGKTKSTKVTAGRSGMTKPTKVADNDSDSDSDSDNDNDNDSKNKNNIPSQQEFVDYLVVELPKINPDWDKDRATRAAKARYETYIENNWKDGYNKPIKNWKLKAKNAIKCEKPWSYGRNTISKNSLTTSAQNPNQYR